jgi:tetratricopeptide (TPR) repeat protein
MPLDPYTPCPGGTGKKVKFCCPDLLGELEDIQRKLEGDQRLACLEQIDKLDSKSPDRACLLSMKAMLEAQLAEEGKAEATIARFLEKYPGNPVALAEDATLKAAKQGGKAAVESLQRAIAASNGAMMPQVYDAIAVVGERLLADGEYIAARGHLMLLLDLSGHKDERTTSLVMGLDGSAQLPLLMKESQPLVPAPEGALWKKSFDSAMELVRRAQWLEAANKLFELAKSAGDWPPIWRNIATLRLWLADTQGAIEALRKYARQPLGSSAAPPLDDMVEAEALVQLIDADHIDHVDVLTITYPITDFDRAIAQLSSDPRFVRLPVDPARLAVEGQPPPKAAMWLLDRVPPTSGKGITREQIPRVVGQVFVFGKQTDRDARLELFTYRTEELTKSQRVLSEVVGDALGPAEPEKVTTRTPAVSHALSWNWRLPEDTPVEEREALIAAERRTVLLEKWPAMKLKVLDGAAPQDAARDPAMRVPVLAAVLNLELSSMNDGDELDFNELRSKLGLPQTTKIDPTGLEVMLVPLARLHRLDAAKLTDEQLEAAYARAAHYRHVAAIRLFSEEALKRPDFEKKIPKQEVYGQLAQVERHPQKAIGYIDQARKAAEAAGQSSAPWDITEMTLRLSMGDFPEADRLLQHVRNEHIREPGVANLLFQVLVEAGVIRPDGTPTVGPTPQGEAPGLMPGVAPAAPAETGKIWTPGAELAPATGKKSVIWTPE